MSSRRLFLAAAAVGAICRPVGAADWPAYRHDASRSAVTAETLSFPLTQQWVYWPAQPPAPAWPAPDREPHRIDFDFAPQPVVAGGTVYFGSSADDTVRALDAATGRVKWRFTTGGPVRFAPAVEGTRVYVASDDGFLWCLDATTGKRIWRCRAAPRDDQIIGQGRMISRWPLRSGVLATDGVAHVTAGMWPTEGIFVYAIDTASGKPLWCNDTSGRRWTTVPHAARSFSGVAPQGYLLAGKDVLLVPTGRSVPAGLDRWTGKLLYYSPQGELYTTQYYGGSWAVIRDAAYYNNSCDRGGRVGIQKYDLPNGRRNGGGIKGARRLIAGNGVQARWSGRRLTGLADGQRKGWSRLQRDLHAMALAGKVLLVGGSGAVTALEAATGRGLWKAAVDGEARGLAVADGRLVVTTHTGAVYAFGPGSAADKTIRDPRPAAGGPEAPKAFGRLAQALKRCGAPAGYALVIGEPDANLAATLAARSHLNVVCALDDEAKAAAERRRLVETTRLYGRRLTVHALADTARLPYPPYFANLVVVGAKAAALSGKQLYRLLRPCGGVMCFTAGDAKRLIAEAGIGPREVRPGPAGPVVVRGKLPDAFDWDSKRSTDGRVSWPLELAWFGGPGPARTAGLQTPLAAEGRFFLPSGSYLTALDAYNGCLLWSRRVSWDHNSGILRPVPRGTAMYAYQDLAADADTVCLNLRNSLAVAFDAPTGQVKQYYGLRRPSQHFSLEKPQSFVVKTDEKHVAKLTLAQTPTGLELTLLTVDPKLCHPATQNRVIGETYWGGGDYWDLFFDFRPPESRFGLYSPGAFHIVVIPAGEKPTAHAGAGPEHPPFHFSGTAIAKGAGGRLKIRWDDVKRFAGKAPAPFAFGFALTAYDGAGKKTATRAYYFADANAWSLNNGWATFVLDSSPARRPPKAFQTLVADYGRLPKRLRQGCRPPLVVQGDRRPARAGRYATRIDPLTGQTEPFRYARSYGCGGTIISQHMDIFRSGTLGLYDLAEDSGIRSFGGTRPTCGVSVLPALGLLLSAANNSACKCGYNFDCSFALAPTARRSNEDWAVFPSRGRRPAGAPIQQAAVNLGAPGDRRDSRQTLWLGFPRPDGGLRDLYNRSLNIPFARRLPLQVDVHPKLGPYRFNADRTKIEGTDRPWIYASGYRGLKSAVLEVDPAQPVVSHPAARPPKIDGSLSDTCWDAKAAVDLGDRNAVLLRHDDAALYAGFRRPATFDRKGRQTPWRKAAVGHDANVWKDDAWEVFLADDRKRAVVHLGVSASGARYDARCLYARDKVECDAWNAAWSAKAVADERAFVVEMAIPWKTLAEAGLEKDGLTVNVRGGKRSLRDPGPGGWSRCERLNPLGLGSPRPLPARPYTVRLHFAEPDDVAPGRRIFDVSLQGKLVLRDFDVAAAAGGRWRALVRQFQAIGIGKVLTLKMIPKNANPTAKTAPILSGIEISAEGG